MSNGNATTDDARRISHWIEQEAHNRVGTRACLADLRRERDCVVTAFEKIQQERKRIQEERSSFALIKRNQLKHCDRIHDILDGRLSCYT